MSVEGQLSQSAPELNSGKIYGKVVEAIIAAHKGMFGLVNRFTNVRLFCVLLTNGKFKVIFLGQNW